MWLKISKDKIITKNKQPAWEVIDKNCQAFQGPVNLFPSSYTGPNNEYESGSQSNINPTPEDKIFAE